MVDATSNPSVAPVYMGTIVSAGNVATLSGNMELSVNFPAYNKPVDIWILIALPDGRFYTANESGKCSLYSSGSLSAIASGLSGTKTEKKILTPFAIGAANTAFEPWPVDGTWTAYWLVAPDSNGDIFQAIENGDYALGFYSFKVMSQNDVVSSDLTITDYFPKSGPAGSHVFLKLVKPIADITGTLAVFYNQKAVDANTITTNNDILQFIVPQDAQSGDIQVKAGNAVGNTVKFSILSQVTTPLLSQSVAPSSVDQTVSYKDEISVTIPSGILDKARTLSISKIENAPPNSIAPFAETSAFDVSIDGLEQLNGYVEIKVKYDLKLINPEYSDEDQLMAMRWNEEAKLWVPLPYTVDAANQTLSFYTDHLTGFEIIGALVVAVEIIGAIPKIYDEAMLNKIYVTPEGNFKLLYNKSWIENHNTLNDDSWVQDTYSQKLYVMRYKPEYPYFIQDIGNLLEIALKNYVGKETYGFLNPVPLPTAFGGKSNKPINVKIDSLFVQKADEPLYEKFWGYIHLPTSQLGDFKTNEAYAIIGHELFHRIEGGYYTIAGFLISANFWWIEAAAEYAGNRAAWPDEKLKLNNLHEGTGSDFLSYPISTTGVIGNNNGWDGSQEYQYSASAFIQFLVEKKDLNFKDMIKHVASGSPLSTPLEMLNGYKNINLSDYYRQFAAWGIFCSDSFLAKHPITTIAKKNETLPVPENASIEISFKGGKNSIIDIYKSDGEEYQRDDHTPGPDATTTNLKSTTINVNKGDFLYLVATNPGKEDEMIDISFNLLVDGEKTTVTTKNPVWFNLKGGYSAQLCIIKTIAGPQITSLSPETGPARTEVIITGTGFGEIGGEVSFNGTPATIYSWSDTRIRTAVPTGAITGNVVVTTLEKVKSEGVFFSIQTTSCGETIDYSKLTKVEDDTNLYYLNKDNLRHGLVQTWYDSSKTQLYGQTSYCNGKREGVCTYWWKNGNKQLEATYSNDVIYGHYTSWYENGNKESECDLLYNGLCIKWYSDGTKEEEKNYKNGQLNGLYTEWHENGNIKSEGYYTNGNKTGVWRYWKSDGKCELISDYDSGDLYIPCPE